VFTTGCNKQRALNTTTFVRALTGTECVGAPAVTASGYLVEQEHRQCAFENPKHRNLFATGYLYVRASPPDKEKRSTMASIESKHWTQQELEFMDHMLDTQRDTTLAGSRRCDYRYKGIDDGDVVWMRCTKSATIKIRVSHRFRTDIYDAVSCSECYARTQKVDGFDGSEKVIVVKIGDLQP
jgi:hypothetical protein